MNCLKLLLLKFLQNGRFSLLVFSFLFIGMTLNAQKTINGNIKDETNMPLPGVTILEKGTSNGTICDVDGNFTITVAENATIVISYIGYITQEIAVLNQTDFNIVLEPDIIGLDEVVVVGYGTIKKSDLTGAVASVKAEEIAQLSTVSVTQALQGRAAGVSIVSNSGEPGDGVSVRIRGKGTINNSDPLYVVDGFPTGDIDFLHPTDIESMEVLKDASATAIYGNRGANGVVLITTKQGDKEKSTITFNTYTGVSVANKRVPVLDAADFAKAKLLAYENQAIIEGDPELDISPGDQNYDIFHYAMDNNLKGTDWQDEVLRKGAVKSYVLNVNGGTDKYKYHASGSYYDEDGIVKNSYFKKYTFRLNNSYQLTERIKLDGNLAYAFIDQTDYDESVYGTGVLGPALYGDPITPAIDPETNYYGGVNISQSTNPLAAADRSKYYLQADDQLVGNIGVDVKIIEGLTFTSKYGFNVDYQKATRYIPEYAIGILDNNNPSSYREVHQRDFSWNNSNYINFNKEIGIHSINLMAGQEWSYFERRKLRLNTFGQPDDPNLYFATVADDAQGVVINDDWNVRNRNEYETALASYFGRVNYTLLNRYLVTATIRRDASSKIAEDYRWGTFPSVSVGWNIKNESFLQDLDLISGLKLRGGWGKTGNEGSVDDAYVLFAQVGTANLYMMGPDGQLPGALQVISPTETLQWEETSQMNIGLDFSLFSNKLQATIDYYDRVTTGMIIDVQPPEMTGMRASVDNVGEMRNKGLELGLSYRNFEGEFDYEISGNFTFLSIPEVTVLPNVITSGNIGGRASGFIHTEEGEEMAYFYGYETDGLLDIDDINNTWGIDEEGDTNFTYLDDDQFYPGQLKLVDQNGDGIINNDDRVNIGSANPDYVLGFSTNLMYKGFDLKIFISGTLGFQLMRTLDFFTRAAAQGDNNMLDEVLDGWTEDPANPGHPIAETDVPRLVQGNSILQDRFNDYIVQDAGFVRLKNIQLGYTLPVSILEKAKISKLRVYITGENLITITKYTGFDPEVGQFGFNNATQQNDPLQQGIDNASYPMARKILVGMSITF